MNTTVIAEQDAVTYAAWLKLALNDTSAEQERLLSFLRYCRNEEIIFADAVELTLARSQTHEEDLPDLPDALAALLDERTFELTNLVGQAYMGLRSSTRRYERLLLLQNFPARDDAEQTARRLGYEGSWIADEH